MSQGPDALPMQSLAVVETITPLEEVRQLLGGVDAPSFSLEHCAESPNGYHWFNVCVDMDDAERAIATIRAVLNELLALADRGLVDHFRIVTGTYLLRPLAGFDDGGDAA